MSDLSEFWVDQEKTEFNARSEASMREYLRSKSWVEKVRSIERMNVASRLAKAAMRKARGEKVVGLEEV